MSRLRRATPAARCLYGFDLAFLHSYEFAMNCPLACYLTRAPWEAAVVTDIARNNNFIDPIQRFMCCVIPYRTSSKGTGGVFIFPGLMPFIR